MCFLCFLFISCYVWEDISNTWESVSSGYTTPQILLCIVFFQLSSHGPFKWFRLLPDIHLTSIEWLMLSKSWESLTKVGWSVQMVLTRPKFFENKGKVVWKAGKRLIRFKLDLTSIFWQAFDFFQRQQQSCRPVQMDPTFVQQNWWKKN